MKLPGGWGVLPPHIGGGVLPILSNPDPVYDKKWVFQYPVYDMKYKAFYPVYDITALSMTVTEAESVPCL